MFSGILFAYAVVMAALMQLAYNHVGQKYRNEKQEIIEKSNSFRVFYLILRISYMPILYFSLFRGVLAFNPPAPLLVAGLVISFLGAAMFIYAKTILGANYSPCYDSFVPLSITKDGIYRYIRHPIYASNILNFLGVACFTGSYVFFALAAILTAYYGRSAHREEKILKEIFPEYGTYQRQSGMFFPKWNKS
jgi:protein-S-isoprenylcysteine O-methyltransferase Ste14